MRFVDCDLKNQLPTKRDIINFGLYLRHRSDRRRKLGVYKQEILRKVRLLWQRAGIPILSNSVTRRKLDSVVNKYYNVVKHPSKYDENEWNTLFVISRCVCRIEKNNLCNCTACNKIPDDTKTFFIDQCGPRLMTLDNVDVRSTNDLQQMTTVCSSNTIRSDVYSIEYLPDSEEEQEFEENVSGTKKKYISIEDISLRNFCSALDRSDTSVRYGALLATMLIKDLRISIAAKAKQEESAESLAQINELFDGLIIDKNKVYRERVKFRKQALAAAKCDDSVKCISFDGKKEKTLKRVTEANVIRNVVLNEEHITIVKEPGSKFLGYATPTESSATGIQRSKREARCYEYSPLADNSVSNSSLLYNVRATLNNTKNTC